MVLPVWAVEVSLKEIHPNVEGTLDVDLRLRPWVANLGHFPLRPGDWEAAASAVDAERRLVVEADERSSTELEFEDLLADSESEHADEDWSGLDLGVAGLVLALNAAGFATASSCRQHVGGPPFGDGPFIFATGDERRIAELVTLASICGAGLETGPPGEGFTIYAATIAELMALAGRILDARDVFSVLPETIGWDQEAYEAELD